MLIEVLKSKLHAARLSSCRLDYEGSLSIDPDLMAAVGMVEHEKILVVNQTNGERLTTYAIVGTKGSREFGLNGAAARLAQPGDTIIVMSFAALTPEEARSFEPSVAIFGGGNEIVAFKGPRRD